VGSWLVTVHGEAETRTLVVEGEASTSDGALLEARYGMSHQRQGPISAKMLRVNDRRQLLLTTQAATRIEVTEQADGTFKGTFTLRSGVVKEVLLARISEAAREQLARAGSPLVNQKPGPEVPAPCAAFFGGWGGTWAVGNLGEQRLWVLGIQADCTARVSYRVSTSNAPPTSFPAAKIEEGTLTLRCGSGGTCVFRLRGNEIWASYTNPGGGQNNGVFQRLP